MTRPEMPRIFTIPEDGAALLDGLPLSGGLVRPQPAIADRKAAPAATARTSIPARPLQQDSLGHLY